MEVFLFLSVNILTFAKMYQTAYQSYHSKDEVKKKKAQKPQLKWFS